MAVIFTMDRQYYSGEIRIIGVASNGIYSVYFIKQFNDILGGFKMSVVKKGAKMVVQNRAKKAAQTAAVTSGVATGVGSVVGGVAGVGAAATVAVAAPIAVGLGAAYAVGKVFDFLFDD